MAIEILLVILAGWLILARLRDIYYYWYLMAHPQWRDISSAGKYLSADLVTRCDRMNLWLNVILIVNLLVLLYTVLCEDRLCPGYDYMMPLLIGATIYFIISSYSMNDKVYRMLMKSVYDIENIHDVDNATKQVTSMCLKHMELGRNYIVIILIDMAYAIYL